MSESSILRSIRFALNETKRVRVVRNAIGFDEVHKVTYGLGTGSADLVGVLRSGRVFALEVKTPKGKTHAERAANQAAWARALRQWGGFAAVARTVPEALAALDRAELGESE